MTGMNALRNSFKDINIEMLVPVDENDLDVKQKWLSKYDIRFKLLWFDKGEGLLKIIGKANKDKYNKMVNDEDYINELCEFKGERK